MTDAELDKLVALGIAYLRNTVQTADEDELVAAGDAIAALRERVAAAEQFVRVDLTKPADYKALEFALAARDSRIAELEADAEKWRRRCANKTNESA